MSINKILNSQKLGKLIWDIVKTESTNLALIMDKSKIKKSHIETLKRYRSFRSNNLPPVHFEIAAKINPKIKSAARKIKKSGKIISLQTFREIIDRLQP